MTNSISINNTRIDYLDLLKGFAILWIVWYHQPHPAFVDHYYHVPVFFFVSGVFFRQKNFVSHLNGILTHIVVPFVFFYLISYCFQFARFFFENQTLIGFEWDQVLDLFRQECSGNYLRVNIPLWFLVSLAEIQLLYFFVGKLPNLVILFLSLVILITKESLLSWQTYLFFNQSVYWLSYYAIGDIVGKHIVTPNNSRNRQFTKNTQLTFSGKKYTYCIIAALIISYILVRIASHYLYNSFLCSIMYEIEVISFIILSVYIFSLFNGKSIIAKCLRFYGKNSLIVLGLHIPITIVYGGILFKLFRITGNNWIGFAILILVCITLIPIIYLLKKYFPFCVGYSKAHITMDNYRK